MWDPMWWDDDYDEDDVDVLIELRLRFRRKVESATCRRSRSWSCSWGQARPGHECCTRSTAHQATRHACPYTNSLRLITRSERDNHTKRDRESGSACERERENVWLRLWPERSKFVAMTHDYVDHYNSRQAILIMMIEKPFARPGSLERCQWLEINCPSIAQKHNTINQNNNRLHYQKRTSRRTNALLFKFLVSKKIAKKNCSFWHFLTIVRLDTNIFMTRLCSVEGSESEDRNLSVISFTYCRRKKESSLVNSW